MKERHRRVALALMAAAEKALPGALNPYVVAHLSGHVAAAAAWEELASSAVLDHVDPNAVAADAFRTAFGRADLPVEIAGIMSCHHLLADQPPDARFSVRQLAHARFGGEIRRGRGVWSPRWAALRPEALHVVVGSQGTRVQAMDTLPFPDGRLLLATGGVDGSLRLWDPVAMGPVGAPMVTSFVDWLATVATVRLADGRVLVATGGDRGDVQLWDPVVGEQVGQLAGATTMVDAVVSFSLPDGRVLLAANSVGAIQLWDAATGEEMGRMTAGAEELCAGFVVVRHPDGRVMLAEAPRSGAELRLWDPVAQKLVHRRTGRPIEYEAAATVELVDGRVLVAAGNGKAIRLWDPVNGRRMAGVTPGVGQIWCMAAVPLPDGRTVLATGGDRPRLWDPNDGKPVGAPLTTRPDVARTMAPVSLADGRVLLATGGEDGAVRLWDLNQRARPVAPHDNHRGQITAVACLPDLDGRPVVVSGGEDGALRFWDAVSGAVAHKPMAVHSSAVRSMVVTRLTDGRLLMATGSDNGVRLWDVSAGRPMPQRLPASRHLKNIGATALVALPGGDALLVAVDEGPQFAITMWGSTMRSARWHKLGTNVRTLTWAPVPHGNPLLIGFDLWGSLHLWDLPEGQHLAELRTGQKHLYAMAVLSLPGVPSVLATGGGDGSVQLWDLDERVRVGEPMAGHTREVLSMTTVPSADGTTLLATGSADGTIRLWDPVARKLVHTIVIGDAVQGICPADGGLGVALSTGVAVLDLTL